MKKIQKTIVSLLIIILIKLILCFSINQIIIWNYNNKIYNNILIKTLYVFNFNQPYIVYYNEGNILYQQEKYNNSIKKYKKALTKKPPQNKVCNIRINLSLATIKNINSNEYKIIYDALEEAKNNLYYNKCANPINDNGYSKDAEKLEKEIKKLQDQINNESNNNTTQNNKTNNEENDNEQDYTNIENELKEKEKEANASRQEELSKDENIGNYSYYSGKRW